MSIRIHTLNCSPYRNPFGSGGDGDGDGIPILEEVDREEGRKEGEEMKSTVAASAKRRWKWFVAAVLALVFFSLLVPLAFLLGLHNRFPSGKFLDQASCHIRHCMLLRSGS